MIHRHFKERNILTTHTVNMRKITARIQAKPESEITKDEKRFLADAQDEERGIITIADVREQKAQAVAPEEQAIAEAPEEIKPQAKPKAEKPAKRKVKGGKKKKS
ncbi:MAG TPA: hypothetical protein DDY86_04055 [Syntrophaceae bacterium]|nr:hypothetical protein [Syntrophaceae bacterium]